MDNGTVEYISKRRADSAERAGDDRNGEVGVCVVLGSLD